MPHFKEKIRTISFAIHISLESIFTFPDMFQSIQSLLKKDTTVKSAWGWGEYFIGPNNKQKYQMNFKKSHLLNLTFK